MRPSNRPVGSLPSVALRYRHALVARCARRPAWPGLPRIAGEEAPTGATCPTRRGARLARVEAVLFVAGEPLNSRKIADLASLADGTEARTLIRRLNELYDAQASAFRVEEVAGGFQLLTRPKFGAWLRRLHQAPVETRLSAPALETLAVVAYRQPVVRAEIESIRGVQCGEILRQLMERDLVRILGRSEELGRPYLYGTARRFLQMFGLRGLDDLPRAESLRRTAAGPPSTEAKLAIRRDKDLTPTIDLKEESHVKQVATPESDREDLWKLGAAAAPAVLFAHARDEDDDDVDDEEDLDDDDDDDDLDDDEDLDDEDLDDDEWEEVDDDDEDWDEDEDDWDEDEDEDGDEDEDEEWEDE